MAKRRSRAAKNLQRSVKKLMTALFGKGKTKRQREREAAQARREARQAAREDRNAKKNAVKAMRAAIRDIREQATSERKAGTRSRRKAGESELARAMRDSDRSVSTSQAQAAARQHLVPVVYPADDIPTVYPADIPTVYPEIPTVYPPSRAPGPRGPGSGDSDGWVTRGPDGRILDVPTAQPESDNDVVRVPSPRVPGDRSPRSEDRWEDQRRQDEPQYTERVFFRDSSNVHSAIYDQWNKLLYITYRAAGKAVDHTYEINSCNGKSYKMAHRAFIRGATYRYGGRGKPIPRSMWIDFITADSAGRWIWHNLRECGSKWAHQVPYMLDDVPPDQNVPFKNTRLGESPRTLARRVPGQVRRVAGPRSVRMI